MSHPYDHNTYRVTIVRHVDADSSEIDVDAGFDLSIRMTARWFGIDAPERHTVAGKAATARVNELLPPGSVCLFQAVKGKKEKYGRYLGTFLLHDGTDVNQLLVEEGHAVPYDGGARG